MNPYALAILLTFIVVMVLHLDIVEPLRQLVWSLSDVPRIDGPTDSPAVLQLAVRLAYLIAIVAVVKLLLNRSRGDE